MNVKVDNSSVEKLRRRATNPFLLKLAMLARLPLAFMAGLRIRKLDASTCEVSVPYRWMTTNPFRSTYFAALAMAGEMSTGALALTIVDTAPEPISMLITGMEGDFAKKAVGLTTFRCEAGDEIQAAIEDTLVDGEPVVVRAKTVGTSKSGEVVATFHFTWSFKRKRAPGS